MIMSQQLGLHVVAEGIEHEDQCAQLRALKCDAGQGYLFAKPLDVEAAGEVLKTGLPPRGQNRRDAPQSRRRETRIPQIWTRGRRFVTRNRASFAVAALLLMFTAGLVVVLGSVRSATPLPAISEMAAKQPASEDSLPPPLFPRGSTEHVVGPPKDPSVASVTTERPSSGERDSARPPATGKEISQGRSSARPAAASPTTSSAPTGAPVAMAPARTTQTTSFNVVHLHRLGSCRGQLDFTRDGVAFLSEDDDHEALTLKYTELLHALSEDTLTLKSATKTYRFKAGAGTPEGAIQLRDAADRIARPHQ